MAAPKTFHEMLLQGRIAANQTVDAMSILLNLAPEQYEQLEAGKYPTDETLRRLCKMMGWNYHEAQRLIINEMISPHHKVPPGTRPNPPPAPTHRAEAPPGAPPPVRERPLMAPARGENLGGRLREARLKLGQSKDILAMLLKCSVEDYERFERGESPPDEVLRRISLVFNWNYNDLSDMVRAEQAYVFQPRLAAPPFAGSTAPLGRLNQVTAEIGALFPRLAHSDQQTVLAQLELVRDTMRRHQIRLAEPAAGRPGA